MGGISISTKGLISPINNIDTTCENYIMRGEIEIEPDRWQLISIPVEYGYWDSTSHDIIIDTNVRARVKNYIVDQIIDKYVGIGETIGDYISVINTFVGDINAFWTWTASSPPPDSSPNNFPLTYVDGSRKEYVGIWVRNVSSISIILKWKGYM